MQLNNIGALNIFGPEVEKLLAGGCDVTYYLFKFIEFSQL